jgi:hypothetical protein
LLTELGQYSCIPVLCHATKVNDSEHTMNSAELKLLKRICKHVGDEIGSLEKLHNGKYQILYVCIYVCMYVFHELVSA